MRSIRHQLLIWLLAIVVAGVGAAGWLIYRQALAEANELFDYQLQEIAAALPSEPFSQVFGSRTNGDEGIVIQIWNRNGVLMYFSHPRAPIAPRAELGFSTERTDRGEWRVYGAIVGDNVVQLAQPLSVRNRLAANVALRTLWPLIVLLPFLGAAVWMIVGRGMRPLRRVTRAVESRRPEALDPLPDKRLPQEVQPLVHALNGLLARLAAALDTQKAFVADAAHELRTPLAAVQIQAQLVARAKDDETRREALADLQGGRHARHAPGRATARAGALRARRRHGARAGRAGRRARALRERAGAARAEARHRSRHRGGPARPSSTPISARCA